MSRQNWQCVGHKTKKDAVVHILDGLMQNPACADEDGILRMILGGKRVFLRPRKPKK